MSEERDSDTLLVLDNQKSVTILHNPKADWEAM